MLTELKIEAGQIYTDVSLGSYQVVRKVTKHDVYKQTIFSLPNGSYGPIRKMARSTFDYAVRNGAYILQN